MFATQLFAGESIRLTALEPEADAAIMAGWYASRDFAHHVTRGPGRPLSVAQIRARLTREARESREKQRRFAFGVRLNADDRLIGVVGLEDILWNHGEARLVLAIGAATDRRKGHGAAALALILRWAFTELNLYRVWLDVGGDNAASVRFFERHGFVIEIRRREALLRAGKRFDVLRLSLLLEEWRGEPVPVAPDLPPAHAPALFPARPRVNLVAVEAGPAAEIERRWWDDSEFGRLQDYDIWRPRSQEQAEEGLREQLEPDSGSYPFHLRLADDGRLIGFVGLWVDWPNREAWLGVGIGERDCWGQGYGTEAVQQALSFAFDELGLHRVTLDVLAANPRALRAYQKAGFVIEGRIRRRNNYGGKRIDDICMGIVK